MFIDLNIPIPSVTSRQPSGPQAQSKKGKGKQQASVQTAVFTPAQISAIEARVDLLVHLGYTVFALNQTVSKKVDPKTHVNALDSLLSQLRRRAGAVFLKRLTIVLDEESEKGFGLTTSNATLFTPYDIIALAPTTATSFSLACLTHTLPSPLTAHIICIPLTLPRLPFNLRHTLVRAALKNGAVFEINYCGALGGEGEPGGGESGTSVKRNWWASAREVVRVTKGKGILVSGGAANDADLRAPRDVANLITVLGLPQDVAHDAATKIPQSLILRAQTRRTYRAILSEPRIVIPGASASNTESEPLPPPLPERTAPETVQTASVAATSAAGADAPTTLETALESQDTATQRAKKRRRDGENDDNNPGTSATISEVEKDGSSRKRKKKKTKDAKA
ncbi:RNase P subunit p30-domain-containing protein [Sparassis latifolia]